MCTYDCCSLESDPVSSGHAGPGPTSSTLAADPSTVAQSAANARNHTLHQQQQHGATAKKGTPAALAGSAQPVNQAPVPQANSQSSAGLSSSGQAPQHAPAVNVSSSTHMASQTFERLKQSAPAQHSLLNRVPASQTQQPQSALPLADPSLLTGVSPSGTDTAAIEPLLGADPVVQSAAQQPSQSLGRTSLLPHDQAGKALVVTTAQQQSASAPMQNHEATAAGAQALPMTQPLLNHTSPAQPQADQVPAVPPLLATDEAFAWQAPSNNMALRLETVIGYVFPQEALSHHLDMFFVDEVWKMFMAIKQGRAQAEPNLPHCMISEPCKVGRLMLLRLVQWLAGVHMQGTAAKISLADIGCYMLYRILAQAAKSVKVRLSDGLVCLAVAHTQSIHQLELYNAFVMLRALPTFCGFLLLCLKSGLAIS